MLVFARHFDSPHALRHFVRLIVKLPRALLLIRIYTQYLVTITNYSTYRII